MIDPSTLTITITIRLAATFAHGIDSFLWIKNQQGADLILIGPDPVTGNLYVVDPTVGSITNTIVCNCPISTATYDPFNRTTYLTPPAFLTTPVVVQTLTSDLAMGPSLNLAPPASSDPSGASLQIVPLNSGAQGQLLLNWRFDPAGIGIFPAYSSLIYDLATGVETDPGLNPSISDQQSGPTGFVQVPGSSSDGHSVYSQAIERFVISISAPTYGLTYGPVSLYQLTEAAGGAPVLSQLATTTNLPAGDVLLPAIAYDAQFVYLQWQAVASFEFFYAEGPVYIYKADPRALQPVGGINFINTGSNTGSTGAQGLTLALGSYVLTDCTNAPTGPFCSP